MKYSEFVKAEQIELFASWETNLKKRQESLSGVPHSLCLVETPAGLWSRPLRRSKLIVAAMCLAENGECEACLKSLRQF